MFLAGHNLHKKKLRQNPPAFTAQIMAENNKNVVLGSLWGAVQVSCYRPMGRGGVYQIMLGVGDKQRYP